MSKRTQIQIFYKHEYVRVVALIIGIKLLIFIIGTFNFPGVDNIISHDTIGQSFTASWSRWDGLWYQRIAAEGYGTQGLGKYSIAFLPMYPLLIKIVSYFTFNLFAAAMLVSNIAAIVALTLLYALTKLEFGSRTALATLIAFAIFPTAFFLNAPYSEGLYLSFAIGAFYAARKSKWPLAGILGGLCAATRLTGIILLPALLAEYADQRNVQKENRKPWLETLPLLMIAGGFMAYLAINYKVHGSPIAFLDAQEKNWGRSITLPVMTLFVALGTSLMNPDGEYAVITGIGEFVAALLLIGGTGWALLRLRPAYGIYMTLLTIVVLSGGWLVSTPRFILSAFPIFFLIGSLERKKIVIIGWIFLSLILLTILTLRFTHGLWAY